MNSVKIKKKLFEVTKPKAKADWYLLIIFTDAVQTRKTTATYKINNFSSL